MVFFLDVSVRTSNVHQVRTNACNISVNGKARFTYGDNARVDVIMVYVIHTLIFEGRYRIAQYV